MTTVDKMMRRYLTSARDFEAAGWAATEDRDKLPLWERAALAGMCAYLLQALLDGRDAGDVADHLADADEDGQNLSGWVSRQLLAHGLEAPLAPVEATPQPAPSNSQPEEHRPPYRVGHSQARNIYRVTEQHPEGVQIGCMFNPADGPLVVAALNATAGGA